MFKSRLLHKILGIIAVVLFAGLAVMGSVVLWFSYNSYVDSQLVNSRNLTAVFIHEIKGFMMMGDTKAAIGLGKEAKENRFAVDMKIFDASGRELDAKNGEANPFIVKILSKGKRWESRETEQGMHTLKTVVPLENEQRCRQCHDGTAKYLGAISLTTSMEDGYRSATRLLLILFSMGIFFFVTILLCMHVFFKKTIIKGFLDFSETMKEIARGEGDLTREVPVSSADEIGQAEIEINNLIAALREMIAKLYSPGRTCSRLGLPGFPWDGGYGLFVTRAEGAGPVGSGRDGRDGGYPE